MSIPARVPSFVAVLAVLGCSSSARAGETTVAVGPSIVRFQQVDARLYRGGQPDAAGFEQLERLGVKTIVNLRRNDSERRVVEALGMRYVALTTGLTPFGIGGGLDADVVKRFFEIVDDEASGAVFLHCRRGADRTGTLVAIYRIARQGWSVQAAYDEARASGMRWWHYPVKGQLEAFVPRAVTGGPQPATIAASRP